MRFITVRRTFSDGESFNVYNYGDWHRFNASCDKGSLTRDRDTIADDPTGMYIDTGDGADCIAHDDKRYNAATIDWDLLESPKDIKRLGDVVVKDRIQFIEPIIDKCVCDVTGNHERAFDKYHHTDIKLKALEHYGREDIHSPGAALVRFIFTDKHRHASSCIFNVHHGTRTSRYKSTLLNSMLVRLSHWDNIDAMVRGHCHFLGVESDSRVRPNDNCTRLNDRRVYAILAGGYLKSFMPDGECYAEDMDLDPIDIGMQKMVLTPSRSGVTLRAEV
jgi:hypothetical protein